MNKYFLFLIFLITFKSPAEVKIHSYRQNEWKADWTQSILKTFDDEKVNSMLNRFIDEDDLGLLNCPDYNYASVDEKKDFWIVFFSALARAESGLNQKARSPSMRGHRSYGLLQMAPDTAMNSCNLIFIEEEILEGADNLSCGVKLMNWQLSGAPNNSGKLKRSDLENQLFGTGILLWGPLRSRDKRGRNMLYSWFNEHLDQLPFCHLD